MRLAVCLAVLATSAVAAGASADPNAPTAPLWAREFPIAFWAGPTPEHNALEAWQTVKDCGMTFQVHSGGYDANQNRRMLDFCKRVGLKAIVADKRINPGMVRDPNWRRTLDDVLADYGGHPALAGYYVDDEPTNIDLASLGRINQYLRQKDPMHLPYVNILPSYGATYTPTYEDYVDRYMRIVRPTVLSFDNYQALQADADDLGGNVYGDMEVIRDAGLRYGVPTWNSILSMNLPGYRDPTEGDMRGQVFTSLAYGFKGLVYYRYWTGSWQKPGTLSVVDANGRPARLYPIIKQINSEVRALGRTLLGLRTTAVYHTGRTPSGCRRAPASSLMQLAADAPPLVGGWFKNAAGDAYVMVANRDFTKPAEFDAEFLPAVAAVRQVSPVTGKEEDLELRPKRYRYFPPCGLYRFKLAPGDGRLLHLETNYTYMTEPALRTGIDFQFNADGNAEGWLGGSVAGGVFLAYLSPTTRSPRPHFAREYLRVPPDKYTTISIRMRVPGTTEGPAVLFWTTAASPNFGGDKRVEFRVTCDGQFHEYEVAVGTHAKWKGQSITGLRLDPVNKVEDRGAQPDGEPKFLLDWLVGQ